jgi:hypothetical protein
MDISHDHLEQIKVFIEFLALLGGLIAFFRAVGEFRRQNNIRAFENFTAMTKRYNDSTPIQHVIKILNTEDEKELRSLSVEDKDAFISFNEEVSIMRNSGLISDDVALYMFAYDAILANSSDAFWSYMGKELHYWDEFKYFCDSMKKLENRYGKYWPAGHIRFTNRMPLYKHIIHLLLETSLLQSLFAGRRPRFLRG